MDDLLLKAKIDESGTRTYVNKIAAEELDKLSEPCYYPKIQKHFYELLQLTGLTEKDIRASFAEFFRGIKEAPLTIHRDPKSQLLIFLMYYFLKKKDMSSFISVMLYYMIKIYSNLINSRIKFCQRDVFRYTLEHLSKTHLFNREKSIAGAIYFMMKEMRNRYSDSILTKDAKMIALFMSEARSRVRQSLTSFQNAYYKFHKEGLRFRGPMIGEEGQEFETAEKRSMMIDGVIKAITVYQEIDDKALIEAKTLSKIRESLARSIVKEISNVKYQEDIKTIIDLFTRDIKEESSICGKGFYPYVRSLMAIKKTNKIIYFKKQINEVLLKSIRSIGVFNSFIELSSQSKSLHSLFLALYITMFLRNKIC
jgi:hypothetical protein